MPKYPQLPRSVYVQRVENVKQLECVLSGGCVISLWLRQVFVKFGLLIQIWPWRSTSMNPKNYSDFNQVFCISSPNLMSLAWMDDKSSHCKRNSWLTYAFVAVNSNVLAQASYFLIERRQVAECRIWTQCLWNWITSRLNAHWQTDWGIEDHLNSIAHPYDQRAFSPLDPTAGWLSNLALAIYTCLLLLIPMLWHKQGIFNQKERICRQWQHLKAKTGRG